MGQEYFRRPLYSPEFDCDRAYDASTNGVKAGRVVRMHTDGTVRPCTGTSGRAAIGISLTSASSGNPCVVRLFGIANAVASTAALATGAWVRASSGGSTKTTGATVKATSNTVASCIGFTLSSAAAGAVASTRTVEVFITHSGQVVA